CWDVYALVAPHLQVVTKQDEAGIVAVHRDIVEAVRVADLAAFDRAIQTHYRPVRRRIAAARARSSAN
ncbi:MAG: GntR family transcriptional regulator, partial [Actinomycetia bacterium]|nr:GntR family transcriptional regulator [Actinomycetes bacterium]